MTNPDIALPATRGFPFALGHHAAILAKINASPPAGSSIPLA